MNVSTASRGTNDYRLMIDEISFELQMETVSLLMIFAVMLCFLRGSKFRPAQDLNPDLCDAGAVLYQLSYRSQLRAGHYVGP